MTQIKAGCYAQHMLKFSPKIRLGMLINVMLIKKKHVIEKSFARYNKVELSN